MRAPFILAAALAAGMAAARSVHLDSVICNPGTRVTVPATLDEAQGLAVVTLTVNYDPLVLDFVEAREGTLADAFSFDFSVAEETGSVTVVAVAPADIAESRGGTVAEFVFDVRPGSETLHSPLALADVRLEEETLTRDFTRDEAIAPTGGLVRPLAEGGDCLTRLGDQPVVVAAGTTLRRLALADGDALQATAGGDPVTVEAVVEATAPIRVAPPSGGWATARYELLRCPTPGLTLTLDSADAPDAYTLTEITSADGMTTYVLEATVWATIPVSAETPLSSADENLLRNLLANRLDSVHEIRAEGTNEAILAGLDLGIVPATTSKDGTLTARFEMPTLRIVAFDPQTETARVRVIPAAGATIARPLATGVLQVRAAERLGEAMVPLEAGVDAAGYLNAATLGEAGLTFSLGRNLFIKVIAERPATQPNANPDKEQQP